MTEMLATLPPFKSEAIIKSFVKGYSIINGRYNNIMCSISGGSDSDIMLDIIHKIDVDKKVKYIWFNTGLEYQATKDHLEYLENKYNISIQRERAILPIPACVHKYGQPFLSKYVSEMIDRLQTANFQWKDEPLEVLVERYPNSKMGLNWWTNNNKIAFQKRNENENPNPSMFDINHNLYLKEFIMANPPTFKISSKCCKYAKKDVSKMLVKKYDVDLMILGIRKAEGGIRSQAYKSCYSQNEDTVDQYRPLFWFTEDDKREYERAFNITHSKCYTEYGFRRTGCCCCPYGGKSLTHELKETKEHEPQLYKAVNSIFKDSYEYTKQYRMFVKEMKDKENGRMRLF